jgi:hypothetical protein
VHEDAFARMGPGAALVHRLGEFGAGQQQGVGGEFSRRQSLDVEVGFQLAVELPGGGVFGVVCDDFLAWAPQTRPPALEFDLWHQQLLTIFVDGALSRRTGWARSR